MDQASLPTIVTKNLSFVSYNSYLEGMILKQEKETTILEATGYIDAEDKFLETSSRKILEKKMEIKSYPLKEVSIEELSQIRDAEIPSFVLKKNGHLYWTEIPIKMSLMGAIQIIGEHQCASPIHACPRLSAASDENGGCEKVRNRAQCIERYPWITDGFETFNTQLRDVFLVANCKHYH